ncbi:MAG: carboxypeptidase regulatory-like domain-containing protein [Isosphaeraceae bacterium]
MRRDSSRARGFLGLPTLALLAIPLSGCGGGVPEKDQAVLQSAPEAQLPTKPPVPEKSAPPATKGDAASPGGSAAPSGKAAGWGTLKGRVVYGGTPPMQPVLQAVGKAAKDPEVCAKSQPILDERLVINSSNRGVANVFVYLMRPSAVNDEAKKRALAHPAEFDQKNCVFIPHALALMVGNPIHLKSGDPVNHNVSIQLRSLSQNPSMPPGSELTITPDAPERNPGPVSCSIHPWMIAYWLILEHPYFAVTDRDGSFEIKDAPAGEQKVVVWHEAARFLTPSAGDPIAIRAGETTTKDFPIDPAKVNSGG